MFYSQDLVAQEAGSKAANRVAKLEEKIALAEVELKIRKQEVVIGELQLLDQVEREHKQHEIQLKEAKEHLAIIKQEEARIQHLFDDGVQSQSKLMSVVAQKNVAAAELQMRETLLDATMTKRKVAIEQIRLLQLKAEAAEVQLHHLRRRLKNLKHFLARIKKEVISKNGLPE